MLKATSLPLSSWSFTDDWALSLNLSTIQQVTQMTINSDLKLDCNPAAEAWARAKNIPVITDPKQQHSDAWSKFSCEYYHPNKPGLSKGAKIGIGLGVGLPVLTILLYFSSREVRKNVARREATLKPPPPPYNHELDDRHALGVPGHQHAEALPTYRPRTSETERAVSMSDVSSLSDDGERSTRDHAPPSPIGERNDEEHSGLGIRTE